MNHQPYGFLLIDKPAGMTSHDVIDRLRKITGIKKIGHSGTLDPFATGLLLTAVSRRATKQISDFVRLDKTYTAEIVLGATTETLDTETPEQPASPAPQDAETIKEAMHALTGKIEQIPPQYSAIKVKGKRMYKLARQGKTVQAEPRPVTVYAFDLVEDPEQEGVNVIVKAKIHCSSGTYIRALARDLGEKLNTKGYLRALRRTAIGVHTITDAVTLNKLDSGNWTEHLLHDTLKV